MIEDALTHAWNTGHTVIGATVYLRGERRERWTCADCDADGNTVDALTDLLGVEVEP